MTTYTAIN